MSGAFVNLPTASINTANFIVNEIPTGARNSVNLIYTTAFQFVPSTLMIFVDGKKLDPFDYSINVGNQGFTILLNPDDDNRLNTAIAQNEILTVNYIKAVGSTCFVSL